MGWLQAQFRRYVSFADTAFRPLNLARKSDSYVGAVREPPLPIKAVFTQKSINLLSTRAPVTIPGGEQYHASALLGAVHRG